jgi:Bacterial regulatory proteins, luxR family
MIPTHPNDRPTPAPLPLSSREQQVCEYLSQGVTFEAIARHISCSPAAARAYHRRALDSQFHSPAIDAPVLLERPNPLDLCVPSLFVEGDCVATRRSPISQTTITEFSSRPPRRRKRTSRRSRRTGVGDRVALAS